MLALTRFMAHLDFPVDIDNSTGSRDTARGSVSRSAREPRGGAHPSLSVHADRVAGNVRDVLEGGGGLPLVFPGYELGFSYGDVGPDGEDGGGDDAAGRRTAPPPRARGAVLGARDEHVVDGSVYEVIGPAVGASR